MSIAALLLLGVIIALVATLIKPSKQNRITLLVFIGLWLFVIGIDYLYGGNTRPTTKAEYLQAIESNPETDAYDACAYSTIIDEYGVTLTYDYDYELLEDDAKRAEMDATATEAYRACGLE